MERRSFMAAFVASSAAASFGLGPAFAEANSVDTLLAAIGGRSAWAEAKGYRVDAVHYLAGEQTSFRNAILLDFSRPRLRIESDQGGSWRARIVLENEGVRITETERRDLTATEIADEHSFWHSNIYRSFHRLAVGELTARADGDLLIVEENGQFLLWIRQNAIGEPIAFGTNLNSEGTVFGPLMQAGRLRFPSFSIRDGGRWRAIIRSFVVDPELSNSALEHPISSLPS